METFVLNDNIRILLTICLSIVQLPFLIEGWISYFLHCILKFLSAIFFPIALVSFIWWPLDMLCGGCWMACDMLKHMIWNKSIKWEVSARRWVEHFPEL